MATSKSSHPCTAPTAAAPTKPAIPANRKSLEEERQRIMKALKESSTAVMSMAAEKNTTFRNLVYQGNAISNRFAQFRGWRNRYNNTTSKNVPNFVVAFTDVDRQIDQLSQAFNAFDIKLIQNAEVLNEYFRYMDLQHRNLETNIEYAAAAVSLKQLANVHIPEEGWVKSFPDPQLDFFVGEWNGLQLDAKLNQCFRQMQDIIKYLGSNGDL